MAADEFSNKVNHLIGVDPALRFSPFCLRITASSALRKDALGFNPGLVRRHRPMLTYCVLARVTAIPGRSILDKERSPPG
jgi:hypothetical protein